MIYLKNLKFTYNTLYKHIRFFNTFNIKNIVSKDILSKNNSSKDNVNKNIKNIDKCGKYVKNTKNIVNTNNTIFEENFDVNDVDFSEKFYKFNKKINKNK